MEIKVRRSHTSRCKKLNINSVLTQEELDKKITIDSICKEIMTDCFQNELIIDKADNLGRCWSERCCIKKNKICNINNRVLVEDEINAIDKQKFLVYFSRYHKLALKISEISGVLINNINNEDILKIINFTGTYFELSKYKIDDVLDYINTCWNAQEVFDRRQKN